MTIGLSVIGHRLSIVGANIVCEQTGCPAAGEPVCRTPGGTFTPGDLTDVVRGHVEVANQRASRVGRRPAARRPSEA